MVTKYFTLLYCLNTITSQITNAKTNNLSRNHRVKVRKLHQKLWKDIYNRAFFRESQGVKYRMGKSPGWLGFSRKQEKVNGEIVQERF